MRHAPMFPESDVIMRQSSTNSRRNTIHLNIYHQD
jgi:hypothetical protein